MHANTRSSNNGREYISRWSGVLKVHFLSPRFPSKRNRLRSQAANHGCHCFDRASYWLQAAANRMLGRSSGNHDWLLANASDCVWMETGLYALYFSWPEYWELYMHIQHCIDYFVQRNRECSPCLVLCTIAYVRIRMWFLWPQWSNVSWISLLQSLNCSDHAMLKWI